jgi:hypothetical protein
LYSASIPVLSLVSCITTAFSNEEPSAPAIGGVMAVVVFVEVDVCLVDEQAVTKANNRAKVNFFIV